MLRLARRWSRCASATDRRCDAARPAPPEKWKVHLFNGFEPRTEADCLKVSKPFPISDIFVAVFLVGNMMPLCRERNTKTNDEHLTHYVQEQVGHGGVC